MTRLATLEPELVKYVEREDRWYVKRWGTWRVVTLIARIDEDRILGALFEYMQVSNTAEKKVFEDGTLRFYETSVGTSYLLEWSDGGKGPVASLPVVAVAAAILGILERR